ncbi:DUF928 domain-containing protein [Leptolyngbya cf. ectocarpi LEGE 11479]|uniref:DUF928 domain-containing protein n=1 Tax=Leptolyngbya cf. ectocarpi LEGE 11479 TaxID=1828722 RepID=A0A928ZV04_LEPEC|nr:DUF928 domain-containing protein [Leptolyngbya ectocarpi]MBE9067951.1 DUF928 domain-containing protein [Leptolyngbya cf. ectocarpi LEGE 11479]
MTLTKAIIAFASLYASKRWGRHVTLGLALLLGLLCCSPAVTQAADDNEQVHQGLPGRRISGASRLPSSACAQNAGPLVAIVPETNLGTTATAEPTLWLRVPDVASAKQLEFYLFNAQDKIIYQTSFTVDPSAELVGLDLGVMTHAPKLEVDQRYRWAASIVCNPNNRSENISVEGWVDRVEVSNSDSNRLWYDHLGLLVEELQRYPHNQDVLSQWQTLMASARLDQIVPLSVDADSVEITLPTTAETTQ